MFVTAPIINVEPKPQSRCDDFIYAKLGFGHCACIWIMINDFFFFFFSLMAPARSVSSLKKS